MIIAHGEEILFGDIYFTIIPDTVIPSMADPRYSYNAPHTTLNDEGPIATYFIRRSPNEPQLLHPKRWNFASSDCVGRTMAVNGTPPLAFGKIKDSIALTMGVLSSFQIPENLSLMACSCMTNAWPSQQGGWVSSQQGTVYM